jgi:endonuclease I
MYIRYDGLKLTDNIQNADKTSMGKLSLFLEWHEDDPVDNFEIQRNNRIYAYQGNRNPFIDYPEYVDRIF